MPVPNAASAGTMPGAGRSPAAIPASRTTSSCWPASASAIPAVLPTSATIENCSTNSVSVCRREAPKQRSIAAASRWRRR